MADLTIFILISILTLGAGIAIFLSRRLIHSVLALTTAFIGSALVFLYLGQTFIAFLQLFIFVGGLSTYLVVAVASEEAKSELKTTRFVLLLVVIAIGLSALLAKAGLATTPSGNSFQAAAGPALASYYPLLFALALLLFSTVIGSIMIIKRFVRLVV